MNCDDCKEVLSSFMDNELDEVQADAVRLHLALCSACALVCEDLASILDVCGSETAADLAPPNPHAMWCRINNIIESEIKPEPAVQAAAEPARSWRFNFLQVAAALMCVAVISSLLTLVAFKNHSQRDDLASHTRSSQTTFEKILSRIGLTESPQQMREHRLAEKRAVIEYWEQRVEARRAQWDRNTRDAFDRNLRVLDDSANEYKMILQKDPDDELSGEMLDSVMNDKVSLLRDFSDL